MTSTPMAVRINRWNCTRENVAVCAATSSIGPLSSHLSIGLRVSSSRKASARWRWDGSPGMPPSPPSLPSAGLSWRIVTGRPAWCRARRILVFRPSTTLLGRRAARALSHDVSWHSVDFRSPPATEGGWVTNPPQHGGGPTPVQPAVGQPCLSELDLS